MDLQACVQDALEALPETPKAIAEVLIAGGHKAIRGNGLISPNCPISRYVRAHCQVPENQVVIAGAFGVTVWGEERDNDVSVERAHVYASNNVVRFIAAYDSGAFPELRPS